MSSLQPLLDAAGRRRSPATTPGCRIGIAPRNKGQRYPADPPTVDYPPSSTAHTAAAHGSSSGTSALLLDRSGDPTSYADG